ncbi:hypothetical protein EMIHUDRAFT_471176, partial [Emiliania huxleyi CCMP1516]|uniref:Inositol hexakisphosphate and diphosphoinositol-pentakisphosphate kinase n=2 Tax=Emiliania huxleyi TaxID=2903 RepID=A0A0D3I5W4_EMIH1
MPSDDPASTPSPVATATRVPAAITVGVCVMRKKCEKLRPLLAEMTSGGDMTVVVFEQQSILEDAVSDWPVVDVLVAFYSKGFPLAKVGEYVRLREPFCFNAIGPMSELLDRRAIYSRLQQIGVAVPKHVVYDHLGGGEGLVLREDYLEVSGVRINKPFVEKPASAEDHNIHIYYPPSVGGGSKRLFRKVGDCSSAFYPDVSEIRRDGAYIYEEFLPTEGADLKVYTVGPKYAYAEARSPVEPVEARKSPTLDGRVVRDPSGKEVRFPVLLTAHEKDVARRISLAFGQMVNGFDILRAHGASYVCDVNGWSFVKSSSAYYQARGLPASSLLTHGDRTPKQKLKMRVRNAKLLRCFEAHGVGRGCAEAKLKTPVQPQEVVGRPPVQLQEVLDLVEELLAESDAKLAPGSENSSESEADGVPLGKLRQLQLVLRRGPFGGLNRKLQVKTVRAAEGGRLEEALLVAKWGGELTEAGRAQAERLGRSLREQLSRADGADNLLHLHSTFRHDVKFYSSDEGRVQLTAAAIAKGLLELAGELPPILVSLIRKDAAANALLDDSSAVSAQASEIKRVLHGLMQQPPGLESEAELAERLVPTRLPALLAPLREVGSPRARVKAVHEQAGRLLALLRQLRAQLGDESTGCPRGERKSLPGTFPEPSDRRRVRAPLEITRDSPRSPEIGRAVGDEYELYGGESLFLALQRWRKLTTELHRPRKDSGRARSKEAELVAEQADCHPDPRE